MGKWQDRITRTKRLIRPGGDVYYPGSRSLDYKLTPGISIRVAFPDTKTNHCKMMIYLQNNIPTGGLAAVVATLSALVVTLAVDSVRDEHSIQFRAAFLALALVALSTATLSILFGVLQVQFGGLASDVLYFTGVSASSAFLLSLMVVLRESIQGMESERDVLLVLLGGGITGALVLFLIARIGP
ncbi:MAG: hypothetical protein ABEH78_02200 [Haloferacaceae archaeon]